MLPCVWGSDATFRPKWRGVCGLILLRFICEGIRSVQLDLEINVPGSCGMKS